MMTMRSHLYNDGGDSFHSLGRKFDAALMMVMVVELDDDVIEAKVISTVTSYGYC